MAVSFPATASFPAAASFPSGSVYPASASYPAGGGPAPFDPATITDLALFLQYDAAHCTSNTAGQPVSSVTASYGTTRTASQALTLRPTFQTDGISYDGTATQYMNLSASLALPGAFTSYHVFNATSTSLIPLGSLLGFAAIYNIGDGTIVVFDDAQNVASSNPGSPGTGLILVRLSNDGSGNLTIKVTGDPAGATTPGMGTATFDVIGGAPGESIFSGDTANRSKLDIVKTSDNTGTPEDANILTWIQTNYGATI